ncbi:MAG TPA: recombinase family protein [Terriglobales bacterium]|nr:recombinase family protein [Terriglobales bacterium]
MIKAVARVSSREQEREGCSIPAQRKMLADSAHRCGLQTEREFIDVESAKNPGRKEYGEMLLTWYSSGSRPAA